MPNWCSNRIIIERGKEDRKGKEAAGCSCKQEKEEKEEGKKREDELERIKSEIDETGGLLFSGLLPIDKEGGEDAIEIWGTKWDPEVYKLIVEREEEERGRGGGRIERLDIECFSAWGPPEAGILNLSFMFKSLRFKLEYYEEGMDFQGRLIVQSGRIEERICENLYSRVRIICPRCLNRNLVTRSLDDEDYILDTDEEFGIDETECNCGESLKESRERMVIHQRKREPIWSEKIYEEYKSPPGKYIEVRIYGSEEIETILGKCSDINFLPEKREIRVRIERAYRYINSNRESRESRESRERNNIEVRWTDEGKLNEEEYIWGSNAKRYNLTEIRYYLDKERRERYIYLDSYEPAVFIV